MKNHHVAMIHSRFGVSMFYRLMGLKTLQRLHLNYAGIDMFGYV